MISLPAKTCNAVSTGLGSTNGWPELNASTISARWADCILFQISRTGAISTIQKPQMRMRSEKFCIHSA